MQINKVDSQNFSSRIILKSEDARFINLLGDIDFFILSKSPKTRARVDVVATSTKTNGYWQGKFLTGKDTQFLYQTGDDKLASKIINSLDDILNIQTFKKYTKEIKKLYSKMFLN